jgi:hypothetical protein
MNQSSDEAAVFLKQRFAQFLDAHHHHGSLNYHKIIEELLHRKERRLPVDLNALRQFAPELASRFANFCPLDVRVKRSSDSFARAFRTCSLLRKPGEYLTSLKEAVDDLVNVIDPKYLSQGEFHITLTGG